jgi:CRISPR-associated protein Cas1
MIKRTLYFGNPVYLSLQNGQLLVRYPAVEENDTLPEFFKKEAASSIPVEDIGVVILDHQRITVSQATMSALMENNTALIVCDKSHHPSGLFLPLDVHHIQSERFREQISSSIPLRKKLWQQTVVAKIENQAAHLDHRGKKSDKLKVLAKSVRSGDPQNCEGKAALYYWDEIWPNDLFFKRDREGEPPNNLLNYGYAILRAITARNLVGSGLLPTLGIHHRNKYNAFCLADDIMEPYRPYVDRVVMEIVDSKADIIKLNTDLKKQLLSIPAMEVVIEGERSPLMVGMTRTTASLSHCFQGTKRKIAYPKFS